MVVKLIQQLNLIINKIELMWRNKIEPYEDERNGGI